MRSADNFATFMGRLSRNPGCLNGLETYGHVQVYTKKARVQIVSIQILGNCPLDT